MIQLKTPAEIEQIHQTGAILIQTHHRIRSLLKPGISTREVDREVQTALAEQQAEAVFLNYPGLTPFPAASCISVNEQLIHGIPGDRVLQEGDLVTVDIGCRYQGWCAEAAWTYPIGAVSPEGLRLLSLGESLMDQVIQRCLPGRSWSELLEDLEARFHLAECSLITNYSGHGIGRHLHEDPQVPVVAPRWFFQRDFVLEPGLVLAIEPMITLGDPEIWVAEDGWTIETIDDAWSVHYEQTVAITEAGVVNLTPLPSSLEKSGREPLA